MRFRVLPIFYYNMQKSTWKQAVDSPICIKPAFDSSSDVCRVCHRDERIRRTADGQFFYPLHSLSFSPSLPPPAFSLFQCEKSHITYLLTYLLITSKQMGQAGVSLKRAAAVVTPLASFVKVLLKCYSIKIVTKSWDCFVIKLCYITYLTYLNNVAKVT